MTCKSAQNVCSTKATARTQRCDLGFIVKDHLKCIFQLLTNELPEYNFRLQTTKCLNTAVMLMQFFLGKQGLQLARECDTRDVIQRHQSGLENNEGIIRKLQRQLLSRTEKSRTLYYILLSDGYFPNTAPKSDVYFPGHVFVLEKVWDEMQNDHHYYFYQSYINNYTLEGHIKYNKGLRIDRARVTELVSDLEQVLMSSTWSPSNIKRWYDMTFINTEGFRDAQSRNKFFLCFRKAKTDVCLTRLRVYLERIEKELDKLVSTDATKIAVTYGNTELYDNDIIALSNGEMRMEVKALLSKIKKSASNVK